MFRHLRRQTREQSTLLLRRRGLHTVAVATSERTAYCRSGYLVEDCILSQRKYTQPRSSYHAVGWKTLTTAL